MDLVYLPSQSPTLLIEEFSVFVIIYMLDQLSLKIFLKKNFLLHLLSLFLALHILFDLLLSYLLIWKVGSCY